MRLDQSTFQSDVMEFNHSGRLAGDVKFTLSIKSDAVKTAVSISKDIAVQPFKCLLLGLAQPGFFCVQAGKKKGLLLRPFFLVKLLFSSCGDT